MKILITTGIYPPDIGGPAVYVKNLIREFEKEKIKSKVLTYTDDAGSEDGSVTRVSRKHILPVRYFLYFRKLLKLSADSHIIYCFDLFSSGLPSFLVKKIRRKKLVIRLGGDFLWEKAVSQNWTNKNLKDYYKDKKTIKEKIFLKISKIVLDSADLVIFTTNWQKKIYIDSYNLKESKIVIIENPFPLDKKTKDCSSFKEKKIIFAGRLIKLKNIDFLIKSFNEILKNNPGFKLEIVGDGPRKNHIINLINKLKLEKNISIQNKVSSDSLNEKICNSFLVVIPSLSEVSPNLVLECIQINKPVILTKESGFYERFKDDLIFINPENKEDLKNKIEYLSNLSNYENYQERLKNISKDYSWPQAAEKHLKLFKSLINENNI